MVTSKAQKLERELERLRKEQESSVIFMEEVSGDEAEQQKNLEDWIRKQEKNDENLYLHIQKVKQEIESDKTELTQTITTSFRNFGVEMIGELRNFRSEFNSLKQSLMNQNLTRNASDGVVPKAFVTPSSSESSDTENSKISPPIISEQNGILLRDNHRRAIEKLERNVAGFSQEILVLKQSLQTLKSELDVVKHEKKKEKDQSMESFKTEMLHLMKTEHKKMSVALESAHQQEIKKCREEMIAKMNKALKEQKLAYDGQLKLMEKEQKRSVEAVRAENKLEMNSLRAEFVYKMSKIPTAAGQDAKLNSMKQELQRKMDAMSKDHKNDVEAVKSQMLSKINEIQKKEVKTSPAKTTSVAPKKAAKPIQEAIVGDWKLVDSINLDRFFASNRNYEHEVHTEKLRFEIQNKKLISYNFVGTGFRKLKSKTVDTADKFVTHWRIEGDKIKSVDYNGVAKNKTTSANTEYSTRYIENGRLVVTNEMGGCTCTRFFERIEA